MVAIQYNNMKIQKTDSPLVSIVIPTYNRKYLLPESFESAVFQTYRPIEIIVIDDGSTDGTNAIKARLLFTAWANGVNVVWLTQENQGVSAARNYGMQYCNGKYILFHDSDDILDTKRVDLQVTMLESLQADVCAASKKNIDNKWNILSSYSPDAKSGELLSELDIKRMHWGTQIFMYKKSVLQGICWDTDITCGEDTEFNFRVFQKKIKSCCEPRAITYVREHDGPRLRTAKNSLELYKLIHSRMLTYYRQEGNIELVALEQAKVLRTVYALYISGNKTEACNLFQIIKPISLKASASILEKGALALNNYFFFCITRQLNTNLGKIIKRCSVLSW